MSAAIDVLTNIGYIVGGFTFNSIATAVIKRRTEKRGAYTGKWRGEIANTSGVPEKIDLHDFKNRGDLVEGEITRQSPTNQKHRNWKLYGRIRGRDFFAVFWSSDPAVPSYGCWFLHQVTDFEFKGYYLRLEEQPTGTNVLPIPLTLTRIRGDQL